MKYLLTSALFLFIGSQALAADITPGNLIGKYKVEARAGFQKVYLNFRVVNTKEFELQRYYSNGNVDETCNGTFSLSPTLFWDFKTFASGKMFKGVFTCPSNRSRTVDFNIDFSGKKTEDLVQGTTVTVTSSMARGMRINAYVKKQ
ncbi:hypothetical protein AZI87_02325 [Bdellovibrio bacteriovorus]|uniref:Lipocalin-like domain-containing protein n=1 Tax=Bdellovibrio bacteriovorus TaxID=959 RepID=A0A162GGV5_BDEBC|nr:hypothetical protein [Bdellovibrio bacteriovorus]KYG68117.1 hypothetical protein AZI87_02325 [Bdellovibrio bacteriovorus]